ncbi:MAG: DoxX family protein [Chlamydiota bacterium]
MDIVAKVFQVIIALGIVNVWIFRYSKATQWRGGNAQNLMDEFATYGLPFWFMMFIGVLKIGAALGLVVGLLFPALTPPSAFMMSALMVGAVAMHVKVRDSLKKSLPAAIMLFMSLFVLVFS